MAHVIGWTREDLEAPQALDTSPGAMLHPVHSADGQWSHHQHRPMPAFSPSIGDGSGQDKSDYYPAAASAHPKAMGLATTVPVQVKLAAIVRGARILGLRKTTFFLTASNLLLMIGLIVLGVVQSRVLKNTQVASSPGLEAPASCSSASPTCTPSSTSTVAVNNAAKICFATDKSITNAVALGEARSECPLPDDAANYTVPGTKLRFKRACETDYPSGDMGRFPVITMLDCIHLCAQLYLYPASAEARCIGVSWVYADGPQGTGISFCYPKSSLKMSQARAATESAVLMIE
ncbi:hypothetical protein C8A05DRAFT_15736 [Staphylotrichum tortipilum]|uniref:Uncharacterized protein n=1 Tax=Staphylotrichum tortipilum TaxID=2831512 RepID=A0AAN6RSU6_9PEZI|nr:hypothetical protein C8A05DRAFT_15736 [Staphylotrichum longicolle]